MSSSMLLDDRPILLLPDLAVRVGLNEAIVLQQVHWLTRHEGGMGKRLDGIRYVRYTLDEWRDQVFPFWSVPTVKRILSKLRKGGYLLSTRALNASNSDRTLWYAVNAAWDEIVPAKDQIDLIERRRLISSGRDQIDPFIYQEETTEEQEQVPGTKSSDGQVRGRSFEPDHWCMRVAAKLLASILADGTLAPADQQLVDEGLGQEVLADWAEVVLSLHEGVPHATIREIGLLAAWLTDDKDGRWYIISNNLQSPRKLKRIRRRDDAGAKVSTGVHWFTYLKTRAGIGKKQTVDPIGHGFSAGLAAGTPAKR